MNDEPLMEQEDDEPILGMIAPEWNPEAPEGTLDIADLHRDMLWVYKNMTRQARKVEAPSQGAWALYKWARGKGESEFMRKIITIAKDAPTKQEEEDHQQPGPLDEYLATNVTCPKCGAPYPSLLDVCVEE